MRIEKANKLLKGNALGRSSLRGSVGACRNFLNSKFNQLRDRLVARYAREFGSRISGPLLQKAVGEAEALAWSTPYPLLFLPALAEEKVLSARQWAEHQSRILD